MRPTSASPSSKKRGRDSKPRWSRCPRPLKPIPTHENDVDKSGHAKKFKANAIATTANWIFNFMVVMVTPPAFANIKYKTYIGKHPSPPVPSLRATSSDL